MAFNELDLRRIERVVGDFCRQRTRPEVADELRLIYETHGQSVVISEERPDWRDPKERMHTPVAKLRFVRASGLWTLYWMRADLNWHAYEPAPPSRDLAELVEVVGRDEYCAFFG
jgi:hypothetical protein